jgi:hypothetical protein
MLAPFLVLFGGGKCAVINEFRPIVCPAVFHGSGGPDLHWKSDIVGAWLMPLSEKKSF